MRISLGFDLLESGSGFLRPSISQIIQICQHIRISGNEPPKHTKTERIVKLEKLG